MKKLFSAILILALCVCTFAGCGDKDNSDGKDSNKDKGSSSFTVEGVGNDENADYTVSGDVTVAINLSRPTDYEAVLDKFQELYPNVNLIIDYFSGSDVADEYLANKAATNELPDVVFDEAGKLPIYVRQGWVYPITEFVKNDPAYADIDSGLMETYTYCGEVYALPNSLTFQTMVLNNDILDELNLDHPELDWTLEDYESLLKAATNNTYSGTETLDFWTDYGSALFKGVGEKWGYNNKTRQFNLTGSLLEAVKVMQRLNSLPGVVANTLHSTKDTSGETDYAKKFGSDTSSTAFNTGRVLLESSGTWKYASLESTISYNWEMWTTPQDEAGRICLHADHSFMCSTTENPEAAFQLLRFLTYSPEGNYTRLAMYAEENEGVYLLNDRIYFPATQNAEVLKRFSELDAATEVDLYFMDNIANSFRGDPFKYVPEYNEIHYSYLKGTISNLAKGGSDPTSQITTLQSTVNKLMSDAWANFETEVKKVQSDFKAKH